MKFPCKSCGACCRQLPETFPLNRGDGTCRHFDEATRLCAVYDDRPLVCRIDDYHATRLRDKVDARVYYAIQALHCVMLDASNADVPERTRVALRDAGHGELDISLDATRIAETAASVAPTMRPEDYLLAQTPDNDACERPQKAKP